MHERGPMKTEVSISRSGPRPPSSKNQMLRFLGIFLGCVTVYYALTLSPWVDAKLILPVMKISAHGTAALLNLFGAKTSANGVVVRGAHYAVAVRRGCDPLEPIVLFAAGVMAFPAPWRRKLTGMALGGILLFGLNLARIASLYLLGAGQSPLFDRLHLWWWPAFFILCSLGLWVLWLLWVNRLGFSAASGSPAPSSVSRPRAS